MSYEQKTTNEQEKEIERKRAKFKKEMSKLREAVRLQHKMLKEQALRAAEELEKSGTIQTQLIMVEIIKELRPEINAGFVHYDTVYNWIPGKYKQDKMKLRFKGDRISDHEIVDLPTMTAELIEAVAGLRFEDIRQMSVQEFIRKYREIYLHKLQTMSDDEVHYYALILDYLYPMARDMLEVTEKHRSEIKKKNDMLSR